MNLCMYAQEDSLTSLIRSGIMKDTFHLRFKEIKIRPILMEKREILKMKLRVPSLCASQLRGYLVSQR
jgi:hypothetical protein